MNIRHMLEDKMGNAAPFIRLHDIEVDCESIRAVMINEVVPQDAAQDFYAGQDAEYAQSAVMLFQRAGLQVETMADLLKLGVYVTNAVKMPKTDYAVEKSSMETCLPILEQELALFPHVQVIMLMGDVAKKMVNQIAKRYTKRNVIPGGATYKLRANAYYLGDVRVIPSYIMTGGNILIEKSKVAMITEDIRTMAGLLGLTIA